MRALHFSTLRLLRDGGVGRANKISVENFCDCSRRHTSLQGTPAAQGHNHPFAVNESRQPPTISNPIDQTTATLLVVSWPLLPKMFLHGIKISVTSTSRRLCGVPLAGAYAWNISHQNFLMHEPPVFSLLLKLSSAL
ncbi:hypothetical protein O9929_24795 [Vibrio lentus]|nr:hypothetical protein [Vibrio lentus]